MTKLAWKEQFKRSVLLRFLVVTTFVLAALLFWVTAIEPNQLFVKEYPVNVPHWSPALNGLRVALITDVHVGSLHIDVKKVRRIVDETNAANPDLILLLGDYVCTAGGYCHRL